MASSNNSLAICVKMKAKENFCAAAMLFNVFQHITLTKVPRFSITYYAYLTDRTLGGTSAVPSSQVRPSAMLLLQIAVN
jgi:hypothetical protein